MMIGYGQDLKYSTYYHHKKTLFDELPNDEKEIIFLGNSITDMGSWAEFFQNSKGYHLLIQVELKFLR